MLVINFVGKPNCFIYVWIVKIGKSLNLNKDENK